MKLIELRTGHEHTGYVLSNFGSSLWCPHKSSSGYKMVCNTECALFEFRKFNADSDIEVKLHCSGRSIIFSSTPIEKVGNDNTSYEEKR